MNRGIVLAAIAFSSAQAHAHVSHLEGMAHAAEHLWLVMLIAPAAWLLRPVLRRAIRRIRR